MIRIATTVSTLLFSICASACSSPGGNSPLNIGETDTLGEKLTDYAATWEGYAEAYSFGPAGEHGDNLYLTLDASGMGHLRVGNAPIAAPATDPNAPYPPSVGAFDSPLWTGGLGFPSGVNYSVDNPSVSSQRLQFDVSLGSALETWCPLQTSYDLGDNTYNCLPNTGYGTGGPGECFIGASSETPTAVGCFTLSMCAVDPLCQCDANGCEAGPGETVSVDAALEDDGNSLVGTLVYREERIAIRMTRTD
jgi:hypothetical protein